MAKVRITEALLKEMEKQGYRVERVRSWERKTFIVEKETLDAFMQAAGKRKIEDQVEIRESMTEALREWVSRRK